MSAAASFWAQAQKIKDPMAKLLLLKLADQANDDGICWPSKRTLADHLGCHPSLIPKKARKLEEAGLITRVARRRQNQSSTSNVYQLHLPHAGGVRADRGEGIQTDIPGGLRPPEPSQKEDTAVRRRVKTANDLLWDALVEATGINPSTTAEKSRFAKSVKELLEVKATPEEIKVRARRWPMKYPGATLTDRALVNRWGELGTRRKLASAPCPECGAELSPNKLKEHRYTIHDIGSLCSDCGQVTGPDETHTCQAVGG